MDEGYPLFIAVKTRYYPYGFVTYNPTTEEWVGYFLLFPIKASHVSYPISPLLRALAVSFCASRGLVYYEPACNYHPNDLTDKNEVLTEGVEYFEWYCKEIYLPAILSRYATNRGSK